MNEIDLKSIIEQHPDCVINGSKLKGIILDLYPDTPKAVINTLVLMANSGMAKEIQDTALPTELDKSRWQKQLENEGFAENVICICLNIFFSAVGLKVVCVQNDTKVDTSYIVEKKIEKQILPMDLSDFEIKDGVLVKYKGTATNVVIPDCITAIGTEAFKNNDYIKSIIISDKVSSIDYEAFYMCNELISVTIGRGLSAISSFSFSCCGKLANVIIPDNIATPISASVFWGCNKLKYNIYDKCCYLGSINNPYVALVKAYSTDIKSCHIHEDCRVVGDSSFCKCRSLTRVTIPRKVLAIGSKAFEYCSFLANVTWDAELCKTPESGSLSIFSGCSRLEHITFGQYVKKIPFAAFYLKSDIKKIIIPYGVNCIKAYAFYGCSGLTSITIPNSVTLIESSAFEGCSSLTSITISNGTTSINSKSFKDCSRLMNVTIPDSVISIDNSAFSGCSKLVSISIPNSVVKIASGAFECCCELKYNKSDNGLYLGNIDNPYYALIKTESMSITSCKVTEKCKIIASSAFKDCNKLSDVLLPDSITSIGSYAFGSCRVLKSIIIPDSVTSIGYGAFAYCEGLTSIILSDSITSIEDSTFYACCLLKSLTIPNSVTSIGADAFCNCGELTDVTIPNSVISIGDGAFHNCTELTSITIPNRVPSIGEKTFYGCSNLTEVLIPDSVTSIGADAFYDCSELTDVTIPNGVTSIGSYAFAYCKSLTNVTITDNISFIDKYVFLDCVALDKITFTGTTDEWNNINKCDDYLRDSYIKIIVCSDGIIPVQPSPLSEAEFDRLKDKVESKKIELLKILVREHYLSEKNSILSCKEIYLHHDDIIKILENNNCNIKIVFQQIDRYIGGYYYILLNKKYENNYEIKQITEKLNN